MNQNENPCSLHALKAAEVYGVYAFRSFAGTQKLAEDCKRLVVREDGIWYITGNKRNVIQEEERWIFIPSTAIDSIAFNIKPRTDAEKAMDDLPY